MYLDANERLRVGIQLFRDYVAKLKLTIPTGSALDGQLRSAEGYLDRRSVPILTSFSDSELSEWYFGMTTAVRLVESVVALNQQPEGVMRQKLKTILASDLTQDFVRNPGKDLLYELEVAAWLKRMQFNVA